MAWLIRERRGWRRAALELGVIAAGMVVFGGVYALAQLAVYGHVKW